MSSPFDVSQTNLVCRAMKCSYDGIKDGPEPLAGLKEQNQLSLHTHEGLKRLVQNGAASVAQEHRVHAEALLKSSAETASKVEDFTATHMTDGVWDQDKVDASKQTIENLRKEMARSNSAGSLLVTLLAFPHKFAVHGLNDAADGKMVVIEEIFANQPASPTTRYYDQRTRAEPCFVLVSDYTRSHVGVVVQHEIQAIVDAHGVPFRMEVKLCSPNLGMGAEVKKQAVPLAAVLKKYDNINWYEDKYKYENEVVGYSSPANLDNFDYVLLVGHGQGPNARKAYPKVDHEKIFVLENLAQSAPGWNKKFKSPVAKMPGSGYAAAAYNQAKVEIVHAVTGFVEDAFKDSIRKGRASSKSHSE